jgi:MraZ protein
VAFRSQHEHSLDAKDRITIPAGHRPQLAEGVVLMEGVEKCVEVWPAAAAERMEKQYLNPLSPMGADSRRIRRRLFGTSEETEVDSAGRVRLPKHLIRHGKLEGSCLVVGVGDHLEIWNNADWQAEAEQFEAEAEDLTERLADKYGGPAPEAAN